MRTIFNDEAKIIVEFHVFVKGNDSYWVKVYVDIESCLFFGSLINSLITSKENYLIN